MSTEEDHGGMTGTLSPLKPKGFGKHQFPLHCASGSTTENLVVTPGVSPMHFSTMSQSQSSFPLLWSRLRLRQRKTCFKPMRASRWPSPRPNFGVQGGPSRLWPLRAAPMFSPQAWALGTWDLTVAGLETLPECAPLALRLGGGSWPKLGQTCLAFGNWYGARLIVRRPFRWLSCS